MSGTELFLLIIFLIPIYGVLIWAYIDPVSSYLFGRRWMYKEDPKFSEETINIFKMVVMAVIVVITFMLILIIYQSFS